jgi:hypothetical protein
MAIFDFFNKKGTPQAAAKSATPSKTDGIAMKIAQEFQDRNRKDIQKWRNALIAAENPEDPRWFMLQDIIDDLLLDAHLASVVDLRKSATLNHRFYVQDKNTGEQLGEQTALLNQSWFFDFLEYALNSIFRKYSIVQVLREGDLPNVSNVPSRNICPQFKRVYTEVSGSNFIDYGAERGVVEILHKSKFGLICDVVPNVIWKRNALQSYAEFVEKFGMPLITATTSNKADVPKIEQGLKNLGEAGSGVLPNGTEITIHDLANKGNPEKTYVENAKLQDQQVSKRIIGSTTLTDEGANRAQTTVHKELLGDNISRQDKQFIRFIINDKLFPVLQDLGFPFDNIKMEFVFDETEDLTLQEQWNITKEAMLYYELNEEEIKKTFNLPILAKKEFNSFSGSGGGLAQNFS